MAERVCPMRPASPSMRRTGLGPMVALTSCLAGRRSGARSMKPPTPDFRSLTAPPDGAIGLRRSFVCSHP